MEIDCPHGCCTTFVPVKGLKKNTALMALIAKNNKVPRYKCKECRSQEASLFCTACNAEYCSHCSKKLHSGKKKAPHLAPGIIVSVYAGKCAAHNDRRTIQLCKTHRALCYLSRLSETASLQVKEIERVTLAQLDNVTQSTMLIGKSLHATRQISKHMQEDIEIYFNQLQVAIGKMIIKQRNKLVAELAEATLAQNAQLDAQRYQLSKTQSKFTALGAEVAHLLNQGDPVSLIVKLDSLQDQLNDALVSAAEANSTLNEASQQTQTKVNLDPIQQTCGKFRELVSQQGTVVSRYLSTGTLAAKPPNDLQPPTETYQTATPSEVSCTSQSEQPRMFLTGPNDQCLNVTSGAIKTDDGSIFEFQEYLFSGVYSFVVPESVTLLHVQAVGGGGGGVGSGNNLGFGRGGGGGGGYSYKRVVVNPGMTFKLIVGCGGEENIPGQDTKLSLIPSASHNSAEGASEAQAEAAEAEAGAEAEAQEEEVMLATGGQSGIVGSGHKNCGRGVGGEVNRCGGNGGYDPPRVSSGGAALLASSGMYFASGGGAAGCYEHDGYDGNSWTAGGYGGSNQDSTFSLSPMMLCGYGGAGGEHNNETEEGGRGEDAQGPGGGGGAGGYGSLSGRGGDGCRAGRLQGHRATLAGLGRGGRRGQRPRRGGRRGGGGRGRAQGEGAVDAAGAGGGGAGARGHLVSGEHVRGAVPGASRGMLLHPLKRSERKFCKWRGAKSPSAASTGGVISLGSGASLRGSGAASKSHKKAGPAPKGGASPLAGGPEAPAKKASKHKRALGIKAKAKAKAAKKDKAKEGSSGDADERAWVWDDVIPEELKNSDGTPVDGILAKDAAAALKSAAAAAVKEEGVDSGPKVIPVANTFGSITTTASSATATATTQQAATAPTKKAAKVKKEKTPTQQPSTATPAAAKPTASQSSNSQNSTEPAAETTNATTPKKKKKKTKKASQPGTSPDKVVQNERALQKPVITGIKGVDAKAKVALEYYLRKRDAVGLNYMISCCTDVRQLGWAIAAFEAIAAFLKPTAVSFTNIINACSKCGDSDRALFYFNNMEKLGVIKNEIHYTALIKGLFVNFQGEKAVDIFEQMKASGLTPNLRTYNTLLRGVVKLGNVKYAMKLFNDLQASGLKPDSATYEYLAHLFCISGDMKSILRLMHDCEAQSSVVPTMKMAAHLSTAAALAGDYDLAFKTIDKVCAASRRLSYPLAQRKSLALFEQLKHIYAQKQCGLIRNYLTTKEILFLKKSKNPLPTFTYPNQFVIFLPPTTPYSTSLADVHGVPTPLKNMFDEPDLPMHVEICAGHGHWIVNRAAHNDKINWVASEIQGDRAFSIWARAILTHVASKVVVAAGDAFVLLSDRTRMPASSIDHVYVNFPEPPSDTTMPPPVPGQTEALLARLGVAPPTKVNRQSVITKSFLNLVHEVLKESGRLTMITDDRKYAREIAQELFDLQPQLYEPLPVDAPNSKNTQKKKNIKPNKFKTKEKRSRGARQPADEILTADLSDPEAENDSNTTQANYRPIWEKVPSSPSGWYSLCVPISYGSSYFDDLRTNGKFEERYFFDLRKISPVKSEPGTAARKARTDEAVKVKLEKNSPTLPVKKEDF
ncbi:hypothetical protein Pelo_6172 [Pelomyxa schiedti]|nr:hypothetical protein Pelo_6172 [Pelomyxa schiedti]